MTTRPIDPDRLGFYLLPGAPASTRDLIAEIHDAEAMGLGTAFISERFNIKEAATLTGRGRRREPTHRIATAATNHNTRHPMVTASYAHDHAPPHRRAVHARARPGHRTCCRTPSASRAITTAQLEDFAGLMRRLWHGETIIGHDGPAGQLPSCASTRVRRGHPAGPRRVRPELARARRAGVRRGRAPHVLHRRDLERCVQTVKDAAEQAGRDPARCRSGRASPPSATTSPSRLRLKKTVGRLATYLQGYGDLLVRTNGWDPAVLERFRGRPVRRRHLAGADRRHGHHRAARAHRHADPRRVARAARRPGTPAQCAAAIRKPVRPRLRRRDHARRDPEGARAHRGRARRGSGMTQVPPDPTALERRLRELSGVPYHVRRCEPASTGFANTTWLVDADPEPLAVKVQALPSVVYNRDPALEPTVLEALAATPVPIPELRAVDPGSQLFGRPWFAMLRIDGRSMPDDPLTGYAAEGWFADADPAVRTAIWNDFVDCLADLHGQPAAIFGPSPRGGSTRKSSPTSRPVSGMKVSCHRRRVRNRRLRGYVSTRPPMPTRSGDRAWATPAWRT